MKREDLLKEILDESNLMIQVCELDTYKLLYANVNATEFLGDRDRTYKGEPCYKFILGNDEPCEFCPLKKPGEEKTKYSEAEVKDRIFLLKAHTTKYEGKECVVEYARDITELRKMERNYRTQISNMMGIASKAQMVFHIDVDEDKLLSCSGQSVRLSTLQLGIGIEELNRRVSVFVPKPEEREQYCPTFAREKLIEAHKNGSDQIKKDMYALYPNGSILPSRVIARLFKNPTNDHLECILWGIDITEELDTQRKIERAYKEQKIQFEEIKKLNAELEEQQTMLEEFVADRENQLEEISKLNRQLQEALDNYKEADYDRRRDFLTGLRNRQDMFDLMQDVLSGKREMITAVYMMDIDNFKMLNDKYGHKYGDECLIRIGKGLNDYGDKTGMIFYRYGGEEILGVNFGNSKPAEEMAQELLNVIRDLKITRDDVATGVVTVSLGYTTDNSHYEKMIDKADAAMYFAKDHGRNRSACFETDMK